MAYIKHTTALDLLLVHGCGRPEDIDEHVAANRENRVSKSIYVFTIDLHCIQVEIRARLLRMGKRTTDGTQWETVPRYGIISIKPNTGVKNHA